MTAPSVELTGISLGICELDSGQQQGDIAGRGGGG